MTSIQATQKSESTSTNSVRLLIADDHPLIRHAIRLTLAKCENNIVVGEADNGLQVLNMVAELKPDILVLDVEMPGLVTENLLAQALQAHPPLKVLILTSHGEDAIVTRLRKVRIYGFMLKSEAPECLLQAVRCIQQGAVWFSSAVARKMMDLQGQDGEPELTLRERQVLVGISQGLDNHTIGLQLNLSVQTIRNYATAVYDKLGSSSRVKAAVWARERGLA
jgi:DNA-binding NarL/FixJ family response regulator